MQNTFIQISDNKWTTKVRGNSYEVVFNGDDAPVWRKWTVFVDNASRRAWGGLGAKDFESIAQIENKYKGLRGISAIVAA